MERKGLTWSVSELASFLPFHRTKSANMLFCGFIVQLDVFSVGPAWKTQPASNGGERSCSAAQICLDRPHSTRSAWLSFTVSPNRTNRMQEELVSFVRAFGDSRRSRPTGQCQMISLTPDGFVVQAAMFPDEPVTVTFPRECISAADFQQQILALSEQAMSIAAL